MSDGQLTDRRSSLNGNENLETRKSAWRVNVIPRTEEESRGASYVLGFIRSDIKFVESYTNNA